MKLLHHYTVTVTLDGDEPHEFSVKATSALAALAQIVQSALSLRSKPVLTLDEDGDELHVLTGFRLSKVKEDPE